MIQPLFCENGIIRSKSTFRIFSYVVMVHEYSALEALVRHFLRIVEKDDRTKMLTDPSLPVQVLVPELVTVGFTSLPV